MQIEKGSVEIKSIKENPANPNQYVATVTLPGYKDESASIDKKDNEEMPQPGHYNVDYRRVGYKKSMKIESYQLYHLENPPQEQQPAAAPQNQPPQPKYISAKDVIIYMESTMTDVTNATNSLFNDPVLNYLINEFNNKNNSDMDLVSYLQEKYLSTYVMNLETMTREGIDRYWEIRNEQDMS